MINTTGMFIFGYSQVLLAAAWHCLPTYVDPIRDGEDLRPSWIVMRDSSFTMAVMAFAVLAIRVLNAR